MLRYLRIGTELRRFSRSRMQRLAIVTACLIPLLYGALYLWAFWDPTGHLDRVPVAIVDQDTGAATGGTAVQAGRQLADRLVDKGTLQWHTTDAQTAHEGLVNGNYYAVLTIPAGFSRAVTTAGTTDPVTAPLQVDYNDANGFTARTVVSSVMREVRTAASDSLGAEMVDKLLVGTSDIRAGLVTASDGATKLGTGADSARDGSTALTDGLAGLDDGAARLATGTDSAATGAHQLAAGTGQLVDGAGRLADGATRLQTGAGSLATGADTLHTGAKTLDSGAGSLATGAGQVDRGAHQLATGLDTLASRTSTLPAATQQLADGSAKVAAGNRQLADSVSTTATKVGTASTELRAALSTIPSDDPRVQQAYAALDQLDGRTTALDQQVRTLAAGAQQVADGNAALATSADALVGGITAADKGAQDLAAGTAKLSTGATALSAGTGKLVDGSQRLADGSRTLADGAGTLATGATDLHDGAVAADSGATDLATGLDTLAGGAHALADGTHTAHTGATTLRDGLGTLADGTHALASGLVDAVGRIPALDSGAQQANADVISAPVSLDSAWVHQAESNGEGFAPYFMGLALYVGVLITWMLLRPVSDRSLAAPAPALRVVLSSWLPGAVVAVVQVGLLLAVLVGALGLHLAHPLATVGFTLLVALAFLTLQQTINILVGPAVGRVLVLILLMLQLTSAGGTYPADTSPAFFRAIHPWLPMTHVVNGLRGTITGDLGPQVHLAVAYLGGVIALSLLVSTWGAMRRRVWTMQRLHPAVTV
ncbi:putative membrane protein [Raineyella antarctica]|uniref:Putative membrane protein n=1 Tax=Raineyella antarctica TaxID=1577474 RepID=A0A1G6HN76_9ACTN|nr:YhgE/Pip domain-containing protein [Raineyella antarctica]SDB95681.1 putative membrane protein [Raineyella antarctica]